MDVLMAQQEAMEASEMDEGAYDELVGADEMVEGGDELDYDHHGELTDQMPVTIFDPVALGLKEINNLAHFSVSSHKPGNGVRELLSDDLDKYWQ
jgi:anaphase-promoting complex subunit 10